MPNYLHCHLTDAEREEFLRESEILPANQDYRLILGYAEARTNMLQQDALKYIWPDNPIPTPTGTIGNYLAFPGYSFAHMYLGWPEDKQARFREEYRKQHNILPLSAWANYDGYRYDYTRDPQAFRSKIIELKDAGIETVFFAVTDAVDNAPVTPSNASRYCDYYIPHIKDICPKVCLGWELNQVHGWSEKEGNIHSGHDMIKLSQYIRKNHQDAEIWLHLQPNWWGPHYEGGDEHSFWRDATEINGLLFQVHWDKPLAEGVHLALYYEGAVPQAPGVAGRLQLYGKKFVFFEHTRDDIDRWNQALTIMNQDSRVSWVC